MPRWLDCLAQQDVELTLVLNYGPSTDDTLKIIERETRFKVEVIETPGATHQKTRLWDLGRYQMMSRFRNDLLSVVRQMAPDYYLSCDTDMLLPPGAIQTLVETMPPYDGIAPLTFMTQQGTECPNWLTKDMVRPHVPHGITEQYAVFGTVLMSPVLYDVDYAPHPWGEDLGWAANVHERGLRLALNSDVRVKHVMFPQALDVYDARVGMT